MTCRVAIPRPPVEILDHQAGVFAIRLDRDGPCAVCRRPTAMGFVIMTETGTRFVCGPCWAEEER